MPPTPPPSAQPRWLAWFCFVAVVTSAAVLARSPDDKREARRQAIEPVVTLAPPAIDAAGDIAAEIARATHDALSEAHEEMRREPIAAAALEEAARTIEHAQLVTPPAPPAPPSPPAPPKVTRSQRGPLQVETRTFEVPKSGRFTFSVESGDVTLVQASAAEIRVTVNARREDGALTDLTWRETRRDDGSLSVEVNSGRDDHSSGLGGLARLLSGRGSMFRRAGIESVRLEIPRDLTLRLETGAGDVSAADLAATLHVESGAGEMDFARIDGDLSIQSGAGDISISAARKGVDIETGAGDVQVTGAPSSVEVQTGAGSIRVTGSPGRTQIETGVGAVAVKVDSIREALDVSTGMGEIDVTVASGGFQLDAETGLSSLTVEENGQSTRSSGTGGSVKRRIGAGGPRVTIESGGGSITVRALDAKSADAAPASSAAGSTTESAATTPPTTQDADRTEPAAAGSPRH